MARNPAKRRLAYILSNEIYGPKLVRLRGQDERRVLDLIEQNRGDEARREILRLDKLRREQGRAATRETVTPAPRRISRPEKERQAVRNIVRIYGAKANERRVRTNVKLMTDAELVFAAFADEDELTDRATDPADRQDDDGKTLNPFWYH